MQTPKARNVSLEVPQRKSPAIPRTARQLKMPGSDSGSVGSSPQANKTPKERSPKVVERKSPRSPISERKRPSKMSDLESQLAQLREDLKKTKDQLTASESSKMRAEQEAEEAKKQLSAISAKLKESEQQILELSASDDARIQELRKISQDRDRAWQSELEAVQKQHSMDSAALASAMNEIQKLKAQLERLSDSEAIQTKNAESAHAELQNLRMELTETLDLVEKLKTELSRCRESEARALEVAQETQRLLETAKTTAEMLRSEGVKAMEACNSLTQELEQSRAQVKSLESLVSQLQADQTNSSCKNSANSACDINCSGEDDKAKEINQLKEELNQVKLEAAQLRSALDAAEIRYQQEYIQSTLQIRSAFEQVECTKSESCQREAKLEEEVKKASAQIEELRANLMDKETELQNISEENKGLNLKIKMNGSSEREDKESMDLKTLEADVAELKATLLDKETELQSISEENEMLNMEINKKEAEENRNNEAIASAEAARAAEKEALLKVKQLTEESNKNSRRVAHVTEQLDAAQAAQSELEAEMRRLKVQSDQWRKAAEAAAAMLSNGNNGKLVDRTSSLDSHLSPLGGRVASPFLEDMDDDSPKRKNPNMLKKFGGLWKKGQK